MKAKLEFVRTIFPRQKTKTFASRDYREFFDAKQALARALRCVLLSARQIRHGGFHPVAGHIELPARTKLKSCVAEDAAARDEIALHYFIQFHLHLQLQEATEYAHAHGVDFEGRHRHRRLSARRGCLAAAGIVSHGHAGRRAAGCLCRQGPELGLPDLQLAAHEAGRLCLVETALRADGRLLRRVPHRPHARILPHLEHPGARGRRHPRLFCARHSGEGRGIRRARHCVRSRPFHQTVHHR